MSCSQSSLRLAARLSLLSCIYFLGCLSALGKQPNIVFVFSDDHATKAISAYGGGLNNTPNLDRIAREGAIFRNSFCANSLCGPSRACILTGKHSHKNGFLRNGNRFNPNQFTFPQYIQAAGYQTALVGKWHLSSDPEGFNFWEVLPGQGSYYNPEFITMDGKRKRYEGYCTDLITDKSIEWLNSRDKDKPFMLMCQHKAPHRNWSPPPRYYDLYKGENLPEPDTLFDDYSGRSRLLKENEMMIADHFHWGHDMKLTGTPQYPEYFKAQHRNGEYRRMTPEQRAAWDAAYEPENQELLVKLAEKKLSDKEVVQWKYQRYIKDYLRCVQAVDDSVGRLLQYLDDQGLAENTIVIYSSDQGFYLGEHGWYDKRYIFEESLEMPFLIRWPGVIEPGTEAKAMIQNIDYAPTFLEVAGAEVPAELKKEIQGRSIVPVLKNQGQPTSDWRDAVYYAYYENAAVHMAPLHDGVRTDRYKLVFFPRTREWNLFDLQEDPREMKSVHGAPEYASVLEGMQKRYADLRNFYDVNRATIPSTRGDEKWWKERFAKQIKAAQDPKVRLAFIGDSITQGWEGKGKNVWDEFYGSRNAINMGCSGDRTEHVIWRLQKGLGKIKPEVVVLMIGTNNTGHFMQEPAEVAEGVEKILEILAEKLPKTKVILQGIFPRGAQPLDEKRLNNVAINQRIRRLADGERVHYLDIADKFLSENGELSKEIMPDLLHLNEKGYQIWAEALEPTLSELGL